MTTTTISRPTVRERASELPPSVGTWNIARSSSSNSVDIAMVDRNDAPENGQGEPANAIASPAKTGTPQVMPASTRLK
ncbi:signal peptide protein [Rhodopirellula europaea 6C]|uniref:Signal peptide protein n=1 Tax=Rhodopirellula europaea 6C TaxID=1263867 RepID=M2AYZ3_9BACT|nr:signal peptide protein [Rhodopirellula europaea 6C]